MGGKGSGGRNAKTAEMRLLQGNPGKRSINLNAPKPPKGVPTKPKFLIGESAEEWDRIIPVLAKMGDVTGADRAAVAAYCSAYGQFVAAQKEIDARGIMVEEDRFSMKTGELVGTVRKRNPAIAVKSDALRQMKSYLIEFGLTWAARTKIKMSRPDEETDPFESFLQAGGAPDSEHKPN